MRYEDWPWSVKLVHPNRQPPSNKATKSWTFVEKDRCNLPVDQENANAEKSEQGRHRKEVFFKI